MGETSGNLSVKLDVDAPGELETGEWYNIYVNVTSNENVTEENTTVSVYSYVFRELDCVSQGWTANEKQVDLDEGVNEVVLEDRIKDGVEEGIYDLRVRVREGSRKRDFTKSVKVRTSSSFDFKTLLYSSLVLSSLVAVVYIFTKSR